MNIEVKTGAVADKTATKSKVVQAKDPGSISNAR